VIIRSTRITRVSAFYMTTPNSRNAYPDDTHENYGGRLSGLVIPPANGNYQFSINNDDDALLRGALTDNPGDLQDLGGQACCSAPSATRARCSRLPQAIATLISCSGRKAAVAITLRFPPMG